MGRRFFMARRIVKAFENLVPLKVRSPTLTLGPFVHFEDDFERGRRHLAQLPGSQRSELPGHARARYSCSTLRARWILLGSYCDSSAQADFAFLKAVQDFGIGDRLVAVVFHRADHSALGHGEAQNPAGFPGLALDADIVEAAGVPQRHKVAVDRFVVQLVAALGESRGPARCPAEPSHAAEFNRFDHILEGLAAGRQRAWAAARPVAVPRGAEAEPAAGPARHPAEWFQRDYS